VIDGSEVERYQAELAEVYQTFPSNDNLEEIELMMIVDRDDDQ
jgi:hypothetical protein